MAWTPPTCCICCDELTENILAVPSCGHVFHETCITEWLKSRSYSEKFCPLCRRNIARQTLVKIQFRPNKESKGSNFSDQALPLSSDTLAIRLSEAESMLNKTLTELSTAQEDSKNFKSLFEEETAKFSKLEIDYQKEIEERKRLNRHNNALSSADLSNKQNIEQLTKELRKYTSLAEYLKSISHNESLSEMAQQITETISPPQAIAFQHQILGDVKRTLSRLKSERDYWKNAYAEKCDRVCELLEENGQFKVLLRNQLPNSNLKRVSQEDVLSELSNSLKDETSDLSNYISKKRPAPSNIYPYGNHSFTNNDTNTSNIQLKDSNVNTNIYNNNTTVQLSSSTMYTHTKLSVSESSITSSTSFPFSHSSRYSATTSSFSNNLPFSSTSTNSHLPKINDFHYSDSNNDNNQKDNSFLTQSFNSPIINSENHPISLFSDDEDTSNTYNSHNYSNNKSNLISQSTKINSIDETIIDVISAEKPDDFLNSLTTSTNKISSPYPSFSEDIEFTNAPSNCTLSSFSMHHQSNSFLQSSSSTHQNSSDLHLLSLSQRLALKETERKETKLSSSRKRISKQKVNNQSTGRPNAKKTGNQINNSEASSTYFNSSLSSTPERSSQSLINPRTLPSPVNVITEDFYNNEALQNNVNIFNTEENNLLSFQSVNQNKFIVNKQDTFEQAGPLNNKIIKQNEIYTDDNVLKVQKRDLASTNLNNIKNDQNSLNNNFNINYNQNIHTFMGKNKNSHLEHERDAFNQDFNYKEDSIHNNDKNSFICYNDPSFSFPNTSYEDKEIFLSNSTLVNKPNPIKTFSEDYLKLNPSNNPSKSSVTINENINNFSNTQTSELNNLTPYDEIKNTNNGINRLIDNKISYNLQVNNKVGTYQGRKTNNVINNYNNNTSSEKYNKQNTHQNNLPHNSTNIREDNNLLKQLSKTKPPLIFPSNSNKNKNNFYNHFLNSNTNNTIQKNIAPHPSSSNFLLNWLRRSGTNS